MPLAPVDEMNRILRLQRHAFIASRPEPMSMRKDRIKRAIAMLKEHGDTLCKTMSADFGSRSMTQSMFSDVAVAVGAGRDALKNMDAWAKPEKRSLRFPLGLLGAKAELRYEPKGVVGILSPWNFPVNLAFAPLMQILAGGNRAMIKPSEYTERTSLLMKELVSEFFTQDEVAIITGGPDVAAEFSGLRFDHILFTGSTATGRRVMQAAAANLVPVTLELGGKSPTVIGKDADVTRAAQRIALGKMMNAGQICLAPDYLFVPEGQDGQIIDALTHAVGEMYPSLLDNSDYCSIISDHHFSRLKGLVNDARAKGAQITEINPAQEEFAGANVRKLPLTILNGVTSDMAVMQEEIFGPVLPVMTYRDIDEVVEYINAHDRPLGLYYFGNDRQEREHVLTRTISGGVTVNDVMLHGSMEDLPFGGIGASGIGAYHAIEGFREFSHARAVLRQPKANVMKLAGFQPPYGKASAKAIKVLMK
ncbi:coniferyl aldehyde dehydrogenase [Erythrobacteraceae bacterium E2-1 Yellow Sea]|nr:coniferyl aldehyde dehydrogenase [Erythrobacteraceae bacterium E2-1 Yellow Sea]